ncbi:calcium-binding protein CP1-like [Prosopis cineraria]|uniref:calcium-binding protein CP1-like n=1 Tax=Prosopis cineraria TaxID=364024 RepID=UPI0024103F6B|nr:calcium-binding protein CP1-like [Prosopis cineraria]
MCSSGCRSLLRHHASSSSSAAINTPFRVAFNKIDVDHDGRISHDDLQSFYHRFCHDMDDHTKNRDIIETMMKEADTDHNGFVEYEEFEHVLERAADGGKSAWGCGVMKEVFRIMDMHDHDDKLSHKDLKSFMEWAGLAVSDQDIDDMIALGGGDQNDGVSFGGFIRILGLEP